MLKTAPQKHTADVTQIGERFEAGLLLEHLQEFLVEVALQQTTLELTADGLLPHLQASLEPPNIDKYPQKYG